MTTPLTPGGARSAWHEALQAGPDCLSIEALSVQELDEAAAAHLRTCARCEAERRLWLAFDQSEPVPGEGAAVEWVARETKRRLFVDADAVPRATWQGRRFGVPRWALSLGAAAMIAIGIYVMARPPVLEAPAIAPGSVYRAVKVEVEAPSGDLTAPPVVFSWQAVPGAVRYDVDVLEVDGTVLWRGSAIDTRLTVPDLVRDAAKPARTLAWRVTARDTAGRVIGEPGTTTFRVAPAPRP